MELVIAPIAELRPQITQLFEEAVGATLERRVGAGAGRSFACGLTGGSTALIFLGALREAAVSWSHVTLYWGDERAVPPDHPDSNYGLAERLLLSPLGGRAPNAVRMPADGPDLEQAAREYAERLPAVLDLLILGVGDDGHVCSLFPGHPALARDDQTVLAIHDSPKPPPRRLTLSLPFICAAGAVWIIAIGPRKLGVVEQAVSRRIGPSATPVDFVVSKAKHVSVFTDQAVRRQ